MWPKRLLQVAQNIRGMLDDSGIAEFFLLARSYGLRSLDDVGSYDDRYRGALGSLTRSMTSLLDVEKLSVPLGDVHEGVLEAKSRLESISEKIVSTEPFAESLEFLRPEMLEQNVSNLPVFNFIPLSKVSELGLATLRLMVAVEEEGVGKAKARYLLHWNIVKKNTN